MLLYLVAVEKGTAVGFHFPTVFFDPIRAGSYHPQGMFCEQFGLLFLDLLGHGFLTQPVIAVVDADSKGVNCGTSRTAIMTNLRASSNEVFSVIAVFSLARLKAGRASCNVNKTKKAGRVKPPACSPGLALPCCNSLRSAGNYTLHAYRS